MATQSTLQDKHLLTEQETAKYLGMSRSFLRQGRMNGDRKGRTPSPPYLRIGQRAIRYEVEQLNAWLEQFRQEPSRLKPEEINNVTSK